MKKLIFFIVILCTPLAIEAKSLHILGLGDSVTNGYGVKESYFDTICSILKEEHDRNVACTNFSVNGLTSSQLRDHMDEKTIIAEIKKANYIFISVGGNDFLKEIKSHFHKNYLEIDQINLIKPNQIFQENIQKVYKSIWKYNEHAIISVVPLYDPYYMILNKIPFLRDAFLQIKNEFIHISRKYSHVIISSELGEEIENVEYLNTSFSNLDPHPNQKGHKLIADTLLKELPKEKNNSGVLYIIITLISIGIIIVITIFFSYYKKKN